MVGRWWASEQNLAALQEVEQWHSPRAGLPEIRCERSHPQDVCPAMVRESIPLVGLCFLRPADYTIGLAAISPLSIWLNGGATFIPVRTLSGL